MVIIIQIGNTNPEMYTGAYVENIKRGSDGLLYCLTNGDDCFTLREGKLVDYYGHDVTGNMGITSILPDPDNPGNVYMSTGDAGFYYGDPKDLGIMKKTDITPLSDVMEIQKFGDQIWICDRNGIGVLVLYIRRRMSALEAKHREQARRERIEGELKMASRIQSGMLPHEFPPFPDRKEFDIYASMELAKEIGGDFYDYFFVDDDHLCIVIADVSGKGVPAALFMMVSKAILQSVGGMCSSAAEILNIANESICSNNQEEMFVTVWIGILEISTGKLTAANAGHEYPAVRQPGESFELLKDKHSFVVGGVNGIKYKEYEVLLKPGAKVFVYTDGVPEATDADENMFGTDRMVEALNIDPEASPEQVLKNVRSSVREFVKDAEQFDDLTMLCIEYHHPTNAKQ